MINRFTSIFTSRKGLLIFLSAVVLIIVGGYFATDLLVENEWLRFQTQLWFSRTVLLGLIFICLATIYQNRSKMLSGINRRNVDIAMFRILFFSFFFVGLIFMGGKLYQETINFIQLPIHARAAPRFLSWLPTILPFNKIVVTIFFSLFCLSSITSLIGYRTKLSILLFSISLFYLFAIPNFYGKVNHNHHILWFALVLGFGRSGDAFSIDNWLRIRKGQSKEAPTFNYNQPFILLWILIGIIYFFPGFWKVWNTGFDWALSDNMRDQLHLKWFQLGDWLPFFRLDQYPILYKTAGLFTLLFEILFLPFILMKPTRRTAIIAGLLFHIGTLLFMHIFFVVLVLAYTTFIPWSNILKKAGSKTVNQPISMPQLQAVGVILIIGNSIFGIAQINSWPFTCYPTFASIASPVQTDVVIIDRETESFIDKEKLREQFDSARLWNIEHELIEKVEISSEAVQTYIKLINTYYPEVNSYVIYVRKTFISPEQKSNTDLKLIYSSSN